MRVGAGHIAALGVHRKAIGIAALAAGEAEVGATGGVDGDDVFIGEELFGGGLDGAPELGIGGGLGGVFGDEVFDFYLIGEIAQCAAEEIVQVFLGLPRERADIHLEVGVGR